MLLTTLVLIMGVISAAVLAGLSVSRPRLVLYLIFILVSTQFIFFPVSTFFISPADVLVLVSVTGLAVRLLAGKRHTWTALGQHRYLGLMVLAYLVWYSSAKGQ